MDRSGTSEPRPGPLTPDAGSVATNPPTLQQLRSRIPVALPAPAASSRPPPIATGTAQQGDPLSGQPQSYYGRLTNPDLLVAAGHWARVQSSFLWAIRFVAYAEDADAPVRSVDQQVGDLYIEFCDGFIGKWEDRSYGDYRNYLKAFSKGKFHRRTPWYHVYTTVRNQVYFGKALKARVDANK